MGAVPFILSAITYFNVKKIFSFIGKLYILFLTIFLIPTYIYLFLYVLTEIADVAGLFKEFYLPLFIGSNLGLFTYHYFINPETKVFRKKE